jgi:hypothetical protein
VLVVAAHWWPLSARLAIALLQHGCRVTAVCPVGHPLTYVSGVDQVRHYAKVRSLASLHQAIVEFRPNVIVPCDDGVVAQLHALHRQDPLLRDLIERSLGPSQHYSIVSSRYKLLSVAMELGIRVPRTCKVTGAEDLIAWHRDVDSEGVLKVDGECGGNGVRISRSLDESLASWRELGARCSSGTAWKRLAINQDPLALWRCKSQSRREVTIQAFISGRPANSMMLCLRGEVLSMVSVAVVASDGPTGAATIIRRLENESMTRTAHLLAARLQLNGFFGLDFMIDAETGIPYLIEMNPRCTQLGHLEWPDQSSLAGVFSAALRGVPRPRPRHPIHAQTIALFPQARAAGAVYGACIEESHHDIPWEEPRLVSELMLEPRPQRNLAARLYHAIRPLRRTELAVFEDFGSIAGPGKNRATA